jgi:ubiquinone/menaquinone biosynthesis C-methylase UbiE
MQSDSGLLRWLNVPFVYNAFSAAVGANTLRRKLIQNHVRAKSGDKVIDVGCGSALALQWLPEVHYIGLDINPDCIAFAARTYGTKGTFVVGDVRSLQADSRFRDADIVMALGVLHHLDDQEAKDCIQFAYNALKPNGRFVCHEACWVPNQGAVSKYIMGSDRGRNIRTEQQYRELASTVFRKVNSSVDTKPMRIPYVTIVLECEK